MFKKVALCNIYAQACIKKAIEDNNLRYWKNMLYCYSKISHEINKNNILSYPIIPPSIVTDMFLLKSGNKFNDFGKRLIYLMAKNYRLPILPEVYKQFKYLLREYENTISVKIISARKLEKSQILKIIKRIKLSSLHKVSIHNEINKSIIGGFILLIKDQLIDISIRNNINRLRRNLNSL